MSQLLEKNTKHTKQRNSLFSVSFSPNNEPLKWCMMCIGSRKLKQQQQPTALISFTPHQRFSV
jgi:hypothetical protein